MRQYFIATSPYIYAGDARVNEHPLLTSLVTILAREHNRIVERLSEINPQWQDETLFHEARRIVIAEIQHITYQQWLPLLIGT
jgi:peroxidase